MNSVADQARAWLDAHVLGGDLALDHALIALYTAVALAACGGAAYCFWQSGVRIVAVALLAFATLLSAEQARQLVERRYPGFIESATKW
jgi:hypothetical protein